MTEETFSDDSTQDLLADLERARPDVVNLARVASLARKIEPELLRLLRRTLADRFDAASRPHVGSESGLWFSTLVESRGPDSITLLPQVSRSLQEQLKLDAALLEDARTVIEDLHRGLPAVLRWEEELVYVSLTETLSQAIRQRRIRDAAKEALHAISSNSRLGLEERLREMWPRLPEPATTNSYLANVHHLCEVRALSRRRGTSDVVEATLEDVALQITKRNNSWRLSYGAKPGQITIRVPALDPVTLDVLKNPRSRRVVKTLVIHPEQTIDVPLQEPALFLRTVDGRVYSISPDVLDVPATDSPVLSPNLAFIKVSHTYFGQGGEFVERGDGAIVAFIDDGIDVLHGAFLDETGKSRIVGIWDQGVDGTPPPGFDFGTYYDAAAIATFVAERGKASPDVPARLRNANGHGTHVASIAAGGATAKFAGGIAPNSRILVVISAGSDPTGYSSAHVAALQFIGDTAASLDLPVVVNVGQGMNAGAHDGKSLLEVAFDEFSMGGRMPGRVIVKSAGNERDTKGHAEMQLGPDEKNEFRWTCRDEFWVFDRLELWWNSANEYHFRLRAPNGERSAWLTIAEPADRGRLDKVKYRMELVRHHVDNGDSRLTVDLGSGTTPIAAGEWAIEVLAVTVPEEDALHAWIERRNGPRSEFVSPNVSERMTLTVPGTATSVITVAAIETATPIVASSFSSHGPTRDGRRKPDVCAPGVKVIAARGGTLDDAREETGTTMAAAHVSGGIALVLSRGAKLGQEIPSATQIASVLRTTTQFSAGWTPGLGYGLIDVAALLKAF